MPASQGGQTAQAMPAQAAANSRQAEWGTGSPHSHVKAGTPGRCSIGNAEIAKEAIEKTSQDTSRKKQKEDACHAPMRLRGGMPEGTQSTDGTPTQEPRSASMPIEARRIGRRRIGRRHRGRKKTGANVKISTLNMRGRGNIDGQDTSPQSKWMHINQLMRDKRIGILAVQEAHLTQEHVDQIERLFGRRLKVMHSSGENATQTAGIAIVLNKEIIDTQDAEWREVIPGRAAVLQMNWGDSNRKINIMVTYAPNTPRANKNFWEGIVEQWTMLDLQNPDLMMGDMNVVEDSLDRLPERRDSDDTVNALDELKQHFRLKDGWRSANPNERGYTYMQTATGSQSRIDRIYVTNAIYKNALHWEIEQTSIATDHKLTSVVLTNNNLPYIGRGRWTIPGYLIGNKKFAKSVKKIGMKYQEDLEAVLTTSNEERVQRELLSVQQLHAKFKADVRNAAKEIARIATPLIQKKIDAIQAKIKLNNNDLAITEDERILSNVVLQKKLAELISERDQGKRQTIAANCRLKFEINDKFWTKTAREKKPRDVLRIMQIPGSTPAAYTNETRKMTEITKDYHDGIQHHVPGERENQREAVTTEILKPPMAKTAHT
ncbi:DNase I-like protein [Fistulina hepatica ATCC 64428]|uniref:DNase I-like protein n=1 Tax=Fistulina hepatica ATCC 64428 TaxID=1128425 RepID=A0A0D7AHZ2_9AGAR|nr:DNase I-like protein [Fistulina hepatica ATCC 64428]